METLSHNDLLALNRAIGEIYTVRDLEAFYHALFSAIHGLIPCEHCSFNDIDLNTNLFSKAIASTPDRNSVIQKKLPMLNAHCHEHPLFPDCYADDVIKITDYVSRNKFTGMAIYNEYYCHLDIDTQITFAIPQSPQKISLIAVSRQNLDFSERDRLILALLRPHLINSLRNVTELGRMGLENDLLQRGAEGEQRGAVLVQSTGAIVCISSYAREMLAKYFAVILAEGSQLPDRLWHWCHSGTESRGSAVAPLGETGSKVQRGEREPLVVTGGDGSLVIKLLRDFGSSDYILVMAEKLISPAVQQLQNYHLSGRETEVLTWLAAGKTNGEIAVILGVSKRTIEKHLERIFTKLGVTTRIAATAIMQGALSQTEM